MFSLESSGSEELKLQVKAMQALVGNFLDQTGEEYARRFKEKYGVAIEPEEAKLIAALAISENKSARQKQVSAGNSARAWEYFIPSMPSVRLPSIPCAISALTPP